MTLGSDVGRLSQTRPFDLLPREAVQLVAFAGEKRSVKAGEILFRVGDAGDAGYFVHSGAILLTGRRADMARRVEAGALIGESALYGPVIRRVDARAVEDAVVTRIPRHTFRRVLIEFPDAAEKVRKGLAARTRALVESLDAARVRSLDRNWTEPAQTAS